MSIDFLSGIFRTTNYYKNKMVQFNSYNGGVPEKITFSNFGSSYSKHAFAAIDGKYEKFADFALYCQSLTFDRILLEKYVDRMEKNAIVVVVIAPCLFLFEYPNEEQEQQYYHVLGKEEIPRYSPKQKYRVSHPVYFEIKPLIKTILSGENRKPFSDIYDRYPTRLSSEQSKAFAKRQAENWMDMFALSNLKSTAFCEKSLSDISGTTDELTSILKICIERMLAPVIIIPPFSSYLNSYFSAEFIEDVLHSSINKANVFRVPVLDYQFNDRFQADSSLYSDGCFLLNRRGSLKFLKLLFNDMDNLGYIIPEEMWGFFDE